MVLKKKLLQETLPISEDGILKAIISCGGETPKFEVDDETGQLLQANVRNSNYDEVYALGEDDYSNKQIAVTLPLRGIK